MRKIHTTYYFQLFLNNAFCFVFTFFAFTFSYAQELKIDTVQAEFENLNVNQGLAGGFVSNITFDEKGYLWINTLHGLQRYDGHSIKSFKHRPEYKFSSPTGNFWKIYDDKVGNLWLRNGDDQNYLFEKSTERFVFLDYEIFEILFQDSLSNMWFLDNEKKLCYLPIENLPQDISALDNNWFTTNVIKLHDTQAQNQTNQIHIEKLPNDRIWIIKDSELSIYGIDYTNDTLQLKFSHDLPPQYVEEIVISQDLIFDAYTGKVYLFYKHKYCELDIENGNQKKCTPLPNGYKLLSPWLTTTNGDIWLTASDCLATINPQKNLFTFFRKKGEFNDSHYTIDGRRLAVDKEENIWIPTNGYGIFKYASLKDRFQYHGENNRSPIISYIHSLTYTPNLSYGGFRGFYDRENDKMVDFLIDDPRINCNTNGNYIKNAQQDSLLNTTVKVSCKNINICFEYTIDRHGKLISPITKSECFYPTSGYENQTQQKSIPNHDSWTFKEEYSKDNLNLKLSVFHALDFDSSRNQMRYDTFQTSLTTDPYRNPTLFTKTDFWFGFRTSGLLRFNLASQKWTYYDEKMDGLGLSSKVVYQLMEDPKYTDSLLWIATNEGINILNIQNGNFKYIRQEDGLPNNVINSIQFDHRNNIWVSTNNGLSFIHYETREAHSYFQDDGLQHNEFNVAAGTKTKDGYLYFGGMGGLTYFHPEVFYSDSTKSEVVIIDYKIFNESVPYIHNNNEEVQTTSLSKPIHTTQIIEVNYDTKMISFSFAVLDLTDSKKNKYRYKLEGFDEQWIEMGTQNEATFTNLNPGLYTLNVQGKNYKGVWSDINDSIKIKVNAPWWLTWWFRILLTGLIFGFIYILYRYRQNQKERIQDLRNRISKDLHDEIGSTLSSIALYSLVAEKKVDPKQNDVKSILSKINDRSTTIMESINDIVWTISSSNESIRNVTNRLRSFTSDLMRANQKIVFEIEPEILDKQLGMIVKRNIYMISKEAINNALKYSNATLIKIEIFKNKSNLILQISDDGIGFDIDNAHQRASLGGNGLRNIETRVKEINGTLSITSKMNEGTQVKVTFKP